MSYRVRLPLPEKFKQTIDQHFFLSQPAEHRKCWYICPRYVYDEDEPVPAGTTQPACWAIKDPLHTWLKDQGMTWEDVIIDMAPRKGWEIWLPRRVATLYKLTWL